MDALVLKLFEQATHAIFDDEQRALNALAEDMSARGQFHTGRHRSKAGEIVQKTARLRLEGLVSAFRQAAENRAQQPTPELVVDIKGAVKDMAVLEVDRMKRVLREVCARTGDRAGELFITINSEQPVRTLVAKINNDLDVWQELNKTRAKAIVTGRTAFVIMRLGPEGADVKRFYEEAVLPAAAACGLEARPVNLTEGHDTISARILKMIDDAPLVVADLTYERPNCYFEAGYAFGRGVHPIFTARHDHDPRRAGRADGDMKVHFDLDGYKITYWKEDRLADAKGELETRFHELLAKPKGHVKELGVNSPLV